MASHHFIGIGPISPALRELLSSPEQLVERIEGTLVETGLQALSVQHAPFEHGGMTLVWILAESHLALHVWTREGFVTIDLHVCDFRRSNERAARQLTQELETLCFGAERGRWQELSLPHPVKSGA